MVLVCPRLAWLPEGLSPWAQPHHHHHIPPHQPARALQSLTSEGLQGAAPPGAGSPTAEADSWSSCAGRFCQGWRVEESSAGGPRCPHPELGKPCSLAGLGSCTASRWAGQAAPRPLGPSGPQGKGCQALRPAQVQLGGHWLSPEVLS